MTRRTLLSTLMLLRSERGHCSRCQLTGDTFAVEDEDRSQRLLCVPCLRELEPDRPFPEPFARCLVPSSGDHTRPIAVASVDGTSRDQQAADGLRNGGPRADSVVGSIGSELEREVFERLGWLGEE